MNILFNEGALAGQTVAHFHIHVIFREEGDGIDNLRKVSGERGMIQPGKIIFFRGLVED